MVRGYKLSEDPFKVTIKRYRDDYTSVLSGALEYSNFFHKYYPQQDLVIGKVFVDRETTTVKAELLSLFSKSIRQILFNNLEEIYNFQLPKDYGNYKRTINLFKNFRLLLYVLIRCIEVPQAHIKK
jgi:hypothetical protein